MHRIFVISTLAGSLAVGCSSQNHHGAASQSDEMPTPATLQGEGDAVQQAVIDRFSDAAGHLQKRSAQPSLPAANAAVNFDVGPFITKGYGPTGEPISYYNFDVQASTPAPIYSFFKAGSTTPVDGQFNLVDVIPGDAGYSDFWNVMMVTVPDDYVANTIKSVEELKAAGYPVVATDHLVNCPIVPAGSTATLRYHDNADTGLHRGWYHDMQINYFNFSEKALTLTAAKAVPLSPIYVTFNKNPAANDPTSGPPSGFVADAATGMTHNVTQTVPTDAAYSPLWSVTVYDNQDFSGVKDLASASSASILARGVAAVNCPVVVAL